MTTEGPGAPEGGFPVSKVCPRCGAREHRKVQPIAMLAFTWDRVCARCEARYSPPTPARARGLFVAVGLGALGGAGFCARLFFTDPMIGVNGLYGAGALVLLAAGCFYQSARRERDCSPHQSGGTSR